MLPTFVAIQHFFVGLTVFVHLRKDAAQRSFVGFLVVGCRALILLELCAVFVNRIVCQVHMQISQVAALGRNVFRGGKPCQSFFVDKDPQGSHTRDQHVNPQVELQAINQVRLVKIALRNVVLMRLKPLIRAGEEDASALTTVLWLNDKCLGLSFVELLFEALCIAWKQPCLRKELEVCPEVLLHAEQVLGQQILAGHSCHSRKVIGTLICSHLC